MALFFFNDLNKSQNADKYTSMPRPLSGRPSFHACGMIYFYARGLLFYFLPISRMSCRTSSSSQKLQGLFPELHRTGKDTGLHVTSTWRRFKELSDNT